MKENRANLLIAKYNNYSEILRRVKKDEHNWILLLFLIYGAIFSFTISDYSKSIKFNDAVESICGLLAVLSILTFFSLIWLHQSLNLRKMYYNAMVEIKKIQLEFKDKIEDAWLVDDYNRWREEITKPWQSKIVDIYFLAGLNFFTGTSAIYRFGVQSELSRLQEFWVAGISFVFMAFLTLAPFVIFRKKDNKRMKAYFEKGILPLKDESTAA